MASRTVSKSNRRVKTKVSVSTPRVFTSAVISEIEATAANTIRITFDSRIVKSGSLPGYTAGAAGAETVESMSLIGETGVELVFTGSVQGTNLIVPDGDPGIRTWPAGFVPAGVYAIPTFP
jgi:hypothetical protein